MGGKPCVRGMRVTVGTIVGLVASGHEFTEILAAYPYLEGEGPLAPEAMERLPLFIVRSNSQVDLIKSKAFTVADQILRELPASPPWSSSI